MRDSTGSKAAQFTSVIAQDYSKGPFPSDKQKRAFEIAYCALGRELTRGQMHVLFAKGFGISEGYRHWVPLPKFENTEQAISRDRLLTMKANLDSIVQCLEYSDYWIDRLFSLPYRLEWYEDLDTTADPGFQTKFLKALKKLKYQCIIDAGSLEGVYDVLRRQPAALFVLIRDAIALYEELGGDGKNYTKFVRAIAEVAGIEKEIPAKAIRWQKNRRAKPNKLRGRPKKETTAILARKI
jgi:hypothetical protein